MFDWTSDLGVISFGSGAWWLGDEGDNMTLVVSEASNTRDIISQPADVLPDAAFMVNLYYQTRDRDVRHGQHRSDPQRDRLHRAR